MKISPKSRELIGVAGIELYSKLYHILSIISYSIYDTTTLLEHPHATVAMKKDVDSSTTGR